MSGVHDGRTEVMPVVTEEMADELTDKPETPGDAPKTTDTRNSSTDSAGVSGEATRTDLPAARTGASGEATRTDMPAVRPATGDTRTDPPAARTGPSGEATRTDLPAARPAAEATRTDLPAARPLGEATRTDLPAAGAGAAGGQASDPKQEDPASAQNRSVPPWELNQPTSDLFTPRPKRPAPPQARQAPEAAPATPPSYQAPPPASRPAAPRQADPANRPAVPRPSEPVNRPAVPRPSEPANRPAVPRPAEPAGRQAPLPGPRFVPTPRPHAPDTPQDGARSKPARTSRSRGGSEQRYMVVSGVRAPVDEELSASGYDYDLFSSLAGPLERPKAGEPYHVQYRSIHRGRREWIMTRLIAFALIALDVRFIYWLIFESAYPKLGGWLWDASWHALGKDAYIVLLAGMALGSIVMQLFLLLNVLTVSRACLVARDPIPVEPDARLRVAFLTTIVPDKEPIEMAERTLRAAGTIVYGGQLDLWLLDEGDSDEVKEMCQRLGVRHFSRKNRGYLEFDKGMFANKTKHGNHNRWLWEHAGDYDVVMFVDTDHVPLPIFAERLLGYFRDPEVAFVVAPQFYGNQDNRITRWAESAQYLFHSVIQRGGNARRCPMLVGTNAAIRTSAIKQGYIDSITEDMATSLHIHTSKSPTGRRWRSVYTPDLVAVGEGPSSWTEFFGQQTRWSAGTFDAINRQVWRVMFKLRPGAMLHYFLMLTYYPSVAIGWLVGIIISACYLGFGISSLRTSESWWLTYYVDVAILQFLLYRFMRRHNVSPHEPEGSSGFSGMLVSALTAPIYARSLVKVIFRQKLAFNVTAKGSSASNDRLMTFRYSLMWAVVPVVILIIAFSHSRPYPMMIAWTAIILTVCLAPVGIWLYDSRDQRSRTTRKKWKSSGGGKSPKNRRAAPGPKKQKKQKQRPVPAGQRRPGARPSETPLESTSRKS